MTISSDFFVPSAKLALRRGEHVLPRRQERPGFNGRGGEMRLRTHNLNGDLGMGRVGANLGARNWPASNAPGPCLEELNVSARCRNAVDEAYRRSLEALEKQREIVAANTVTLQEQSFDRVFGSLRDEVAITVNSTREELTPRKDDLDEALSQFEWFRQVHDLPERYRYSTSLWSWFSLMAACSVLETLPNAPAFGDGDPLGALGGWSVALLMSSVNVTAGALAAFGWRNFKLKTFLSATTGFALVSTGAAAGVTMAVLTLHYRYALTTDAAHALAHALESIRLSILPPSVDIKGGGLLGASFICSALTYWKTMDSWGAFPGYRAKALDVEKARRLLARLRRDAAEQLIAMREQALSAVCAQLADVRAKVERAKAAFVETSIVVDRYRGFVQDVYETHQAALSSFWACNTAVRKTPSPAHFGQVPMLHAPGLDLTDQFREMFEDIERALEMAITSAREAELRIERLVHDALLQLGLADDWRPQSPPQLGGPIPEPA